MYEIGKPNTQKVEPKHLGLRTRIKQKYLAIEIAATQTMSACADCLKNLALRV
jgi:hypothetical protein